MCMEDVRIGRESTSASRKVTVGTGSTPLISHSPTRTVLIVSAPVSKRVTLSLVQPAVDRVGITLHPGSSPLVLTVQTHGDLVTRSLWAIADTSAEQIGIVECHLNRQ